MRCVVLGHEVEAEGDRRFRRALERVALVEDERRRDRAVGEHLVRRGRGPPRPSRRARAPRPAPGSVAWTTALTASFIVAPRPACTDVQHPLGEDVEHVRGAGEVRLGAADHDGQLAPFDERDAARHRRVEQPDVVSPTSREASWCTGRRVDRARLGDDRARLDPGGDAVGAAVRRDARRVVGEGDQHDRRRRRRLRGRRGDGRAARRGDGLGACRRPVVDDHVGARSRAADAPSPRPSGRCRRSADLHFNSQPPSTGRLTPLTAGLRRRNSTASATSAIVAQPAARRPRRDVVERLARPRTGCRRRCPDGWR